jgi:transaldolase
MSAKEKYEAVAIFDIQKAADILAPLYAKKDDGYVSIEVDPFLCDDAAATVAEGKRLFGAIARKNVMIKVPATPAGYRAMEELTAAGIPVNATLIFKTEQALKCAEAFKKGIERYGAKVDTVISIFVSRVDRAIDATLAANAVPTALTGIYNSSVIYEAIEAMQVDSCRALFASTGVKDDALPPYYYVEKLLAYNSVNTAPVDTIKAFHSDGAKEQALPISQELIVQHMQQVKDAGIDLDAVLNQLIAEGLSAFKDAFSEILETL